MPAPFPIVVSGSIAIDRIMSFSGRYADYIRPEKLDALSISIFLDRLQDVYGGVGANIAYSLALLGERPILLGSVGVDGRVFLERLAHLGVDITHVHESRFATASFSVMTDADENQIGGFYPGAMFDSDMLTLEPWKDRRPIVMVSPHDPKAMRNQVAQCKRWGLYLCYDVGQQVSNLEAMDLRKGVAAANLLILNEYELDALCAKIGSTEAEVKASVGVVVVTRGKMGSTIEGSKLKRKIEVGVVEPKAVADPTGAGDGYRAGFLYGLARGWGLKTCGQLGATCAAYTLESMGPQSHEFNYTLVAKRYEATFGALPHKA